MQSADSASAERSLVLAAPARRRLIAEMLARESTWTPGDKLLYAEMIRFEAQHTLAWLVDPKLRELPTLKRRIFERLILQGVGAVDAIQAAERQATLALKEPTPGERERKRRAARRESVTALDGAKAVTAGLIANCIVCGAPITQRRPSSRRRWRADAAYCSNGCRQRAYRERRKCRS